MQKRLRLVLMVLSLLCLLPLIARAQGEIVPVELKIMTFNIWLGGELVDFGKVVEAIQQADADVVGLQEAMGNTRRLAEALGWQHYSERMQIISRYPLIDPPDGNGVYIFVQINPGQVVALANVHLPSSPYGPEAVRDGMALEAVLQQERDTRLVALQPQLDVLPGLVAAGIPVLLTGDFNTPSHLDWTEPMISVRDQVTMAVEWPVTKALEDLGFIDTYRAVHSDPTQRIGMTWTPGYPVPRIRENEVVDRIDLVLASGVLEVLDSQIVGEAGGADVDIGIAPYPSDHRGVVSTVRLTPAVPPLFVTTDQRVIERGAAITVRYHAPNGEERDLLGILPAGGSVPDDLLMTLPPYEASFFGSVMFGSAALPVGEYNAVLLAEGTEEISRSTFWVVDADVPPSVAVENESYAVGEPITVKWKNAPALRWDWLGIYAADDANLYNYWGFLYTQAMPTGSVTFTIDDLGELPPGEYVARLMLDDGYAVLATSMPFTVK
jgi:endonuclease/exonuclease/phosphatase family metal-dependent hydrolase